MFARVAQNLYAGKRPVDTRETPGDDSCQAQQGTDIYVGFVSQSGLSLQPSLRKGLLPLAVALISLPA